MRLSPAAEFAVRGAIVLAEHYGRGLCKLEAICSQRALPREYLAKIFGSMARAGLVNPVRGKGGGYMLARDPAQITLLEVIEAVEGPIALNLCVHTPSRCDQVDCAIRSVWHELQAILREKLSSLTLADCVQREQAGRRDPRAARQTL